MQQELLDFIESHINIIEANHFDDLYDLAKLELLDYQIKDLTNILYEADIDPIDYFKDTIPSYFMAGNHELSIFEFEPHQRHITTIGARAFQDCSELASIWISPNIKEIKYSAFDCCTNLSNVQFEEPSKLAIIGDYAFASCSGLKELVLPDSLRLIKGYAFAESGIEKLYLPPNLSSLHAHTFAHFQGVVIVKKGSPSHSVLNNSLRFHPNIEFI